MVGTAPLGPIPQTDPRASYIAQQHAIDRAISRVLEGGSYILGREVESFEAAFADFVGVDHAVGCASGTDAIELALRACNIGAGKVAETRQFGRLAIEVHWQYCCRPTWGRHL